MKITIEVTLEQLEIIADGMSAARCGLDSLVRRTRADGDESMASIYASWQISFLACNDLIPQTTSHAAVTK